MDTFRQLSAFCWEPYRFYILNPALNRLLLFGLVVFASKCRALDIPVTSYSVDVAPSQSATTWECLFTNDTKNVVTVLDVATDCGCTLVDLSSKSLPPGAQGKLKIKMAILPTTPLIATHHILVSTSEDRVYDLTFTAHLRRSVAVRPRMLVWHAGETDTKSVLLVVDREIGARLIGLRASGNNGFTAKIEPTREPGAYHILIAPKSGSASSSAIFTPQFDRPISVKVDLDIFATTQ